MHEEIPSWVPSDEHLEHMREILSRIDYRRGGEPFKFEMTTDIDDVDVLLITFKVVDSCEPSDELKEMKWYTRITDELSGLEGYNFEVAFLQFVFRELAASEVHEVGEWFHYEVDGETQRPFNPHKTSLDHYTRDVRIDAGPLPLLKTPEHPYGW